MQQKTYKLNAEQIAEAIHSITSRIPRPDGSWVDVWCDLSEKQKEHAANAVRKIYTETPKTPEELHDLWAEPLLKTGWTHGKYHWETKQHPCLVPFNELPESEILKDILWSNITEAFRKFYDDSSNNLDWC